MVHVLDCLLSVVEGHCRGHSELFVLHLGNDLTEDAIQALPEVADTGLMPAVLGNDLHQCGFCDLYAFLTGLCGGCRILGGLNSRHKGVLLLKPRDQVVLGYLDLFDG